MQKLKYLILITSLLLCSNILQSQERVKEKFNSNWKFSLTDSSATAQGIAFDDASWRTLNLPHDWSIEGEFSEKHPATAGGGALPGGIGWYRKTFTMPASNKGKAVFIDFDGVYRNSEVWINGHYLGKRPNGYISFRYELTPYLKFGNGKNVIAVKVDNAKQPNSRWYSGSGIYRNVWLVSTDKIFVDKYGTFVTTPKVTEGNAMSNVLTVVRNQSGKIQRVKLTTLIMNPEGIKVSRFSSEKLVSDKSAERFTQDINIEKPALWSVEEPALYKAVSQITVDGKLLDTYETSFGIRTFSFDKDKGFLLNGKSLKILGVCNHHDLGALGAAVNTRALERQLQILKDMGCNGIRTSHNPPAPELLDLCDKMGFIVMDESFDMWKKQKSPFDYHLDWDKWHKKDLEDFIKRDRNHPSVFIWSIGNEIPEQWASEKDSSGIAIAKELAGIVRSLDSTRPVTAGLNEPYPHNALFRSRELDLIGFNYHHQDYASFHKSFPGEKFIATETTSALQTRGHYDMPSDSIRRWPKRWDEVFKDGNPDLTVSAYDNVSAPWGSTHEETWKIMKKYDHLSGMFIWTGFDYLGEPTPYTWPARSSYFGIIDLAGFPKDVYYLYQSEWTSKPVLHVFPHWNWEAGKTVDVWAYYNNADEVELFLNGRSVGVKKKVGDDLHVMWRLKYEPGVLRAVSRKGGREVLSREINTAGNAAKIELIADRNSISADGEDLSFVTVRILDAAGNLVPNADNLVKFKIEGEGFIASVDNGSPTSHEPFKANYRKAFNGLALAIIQSNGNQGKIKINAVSEGLQQATLDLMAK